MYVRQFAATIMDNSLEAVFKLNAYDWIKSKIAYKLWLDIDFARTKFHPFLSIPY